MSLKKFALATSVRRFHKAPRREKGHCGDNLPHPVCRIRLTNNPAKKSGSIIIKRASSNSIRFFRPFNLIKLLRMVANFL